jgi:hypothetical protein
MRINHKQQDIIDDFLKKAQEKFPDIKFVDLSVSPDDPDHIWINVISNMDDEKHLEFLDFETDMEVEIDDNYGYRITMMEENIYAESA